MTAAPNKENIPCTPGGVRPSPAHTPPSVKPRSFHSIVMPPFPDIRHTKGPGELGFIKGRWEEKPYFPFALSAGEKNVNPIGKRNRQAGRLAREWKSLEKLSDWPPLITGLGSTPSAEGARSEIPGGWRTGSGPPQILTPARESNKSTANRHRLTEGGSAGLDLHTPKDSRKTETAPGRCRQVP